MIENTELCPIEKLTWKGQIMTILLTGEHGVWAESELNESNVS